METAVCLKPLLALKCVILTGGRDKQGNILLQFPADSQLELLSSDDLQRIILYLTSIPILKKTFTFIIDMRGRKYETVKPLLKILQNLQESYQYEINHVYIIKPDTFWQKQKTSFASAKYSFEHSITSIEQLHKYVDANQLTADLDGTLPYNNDLWIDFRVRLENFTNQVGDLISRLNGLQNELSCYEQPDSREACQEAINMHLSTKQAVFGISIEHLVNDARTLLKILSGSDGSEILLAPGGTRDSGYSGESEKLSCDYFNEAHKIKDPMDNLRAAKHKVQNLWQQKRLKLEQCFHLRSLEQDCAQMMEWLNYNNKFILMNYTDIGLSYASALELLQKHELFHKSCFSGAASIQHINNLAGKMIASSHYASNLIQLKTVKLEKEWQLFHAALQNRHKILSASCMFHNKADQYLSKVGEWKAQCSSNQIANSVLEAENLLKKHHELSDDISQIYAEVCNDGKAILDSIQSSQSTQIGQMEFKQAASHILDIVYEILSNHRQLEILWVNKKQKLQNRYRILNFQQNIKQVYNWLENHGEVFLRRNQSIGKNLMRAKMLHLSHENFVKVLKNTITNVEKLLASADDLVMNGEFEPQDVYSMTKELEQRMTLFLQRVEKRKNILDLSVLFHTHVVELDNWFNELKLHWTTLNLNEINQSTPNLELTIKHVAHLEKHLEVLGEQKNVTSDAIDKTLLEGDTLLDYLREMSANKTTTAATTEANGDSNPANGKQQSNSYLHLEGIVTSLKNRYNEIDKILTAVKSRLETNLQMKLFEKDAIEASQNLEQWAEELKFLNENEHNERTTETTESWLQSQIQTANQMQVLVFELLQRGSDLIQQLEKPESGGAQTSTSLTSLNDMFNASSQNGGVVGPNVTNEKPKSNDSSAPTTPTSSNGASQHTINWIKQQNSLNNSSSSATSSTIASSSSSIKNEMDLNAKQRIQSFIEYLNEREKELHDLAIKQQRKLGQTLQLNQLENECSQLLGFISNIEITLFSLLKFARNLDEAEQIKKEHEMFKSNLERVSVNVNALQTKSQRILYDRQQQQPRTVTKFEQLMNTLNSKWQMLLIYVDNRTRLIMAQINFYKYTDQVTTVLESLEHDYSREEDWYEKSKAEADPEQYLQAQIQVHNQKKQSFLKACNWARRTGETFQKYSLRNICDAKMNSSVLHDIEVNTKKIMDEIRSREEKTIKSWNSKKNALDECFQFVIFEKSSKEALAWLHESEASYLNKFKNLATNKDEMKRMYKEFCEFTDRLKNQQGYVNLLIELSPKLLESSVRYSSQIAHWANKVETRYKEFFNVLAKVQQANGLGQMTSPGSSVHNSTSSLVSGSSFNGSSSAASTSSSAKATSLSSPTTSTTGYESKTSLSSSVANEAPTNGTLSANDSKKKQEMLKQNEQKQKMIKKRQNIITEIIQTEKSYVQDLCACLESYYKEFVVNTGAQPEYLRGKEAIIFGNLEEIYNFHKKTFLVELENYENMPEDIGHCFVVYADQFQIYVEYCKNKENSTKLLMEDGRNENYFERIQRTGSIKCSLDSYLIKPIQRITKYQLLLKDLLTCCEDKSNETKDALDVMLSVPKKANDAIHLSHLEGLEEGLSKDALGDVLLQDKFQVWDSKQLIKKGKDRHVFLFETSLVFAKEVKDQRGKLKYIYKFKLMTSEINITEHMEGDSCKFAVWTGRAPLSDHRVIMKSLNLDVKQLWVKKIRELIQEKYFYMEVAMCEAGHQSNRNSKDFEMDSDFLAAGAMNAATSNGHANPENLSSAASNASSGTKASNEITTILSDYTTSDNVHLYKGQHVQVTQRSNDFCIVQLLNNASLGDPSSPLSVSSSGAANASFNGSQKQFIEVQVPTSLIKCRVKSTNDDLQSNNAANDNDEAKSSAAAAAAAAKRKSSFKKWLRASHRKFTSNSSKSSISNTNGNNAKMSSNSDNENVGKIKVLSNSEDLKMKNWLPLEAHNEDQEDEINDQATLTNSTPNANNAYSNRDSSSTSGFGASTFNDNSNSANSNSHILANNTGNTTTNSSLNNTADEDPEDMIGSSIPPPMNVIKTAENSDQSSSSSFNKISNQSIDIQRELKLWQTKMESNQKGSIENASNPAGLFGENPASIHRNISTGSATELVTPSDNQTLNDSLNLQESKSAMAESKPPESKLVYAIKELLNTEKDYVNDLAILIEKYMEAIKQKEVPLPPELEEGKTKMVFGNIQQIYEWHKSTFCPELDKCLQDPATSGSYIGQLFVKYENRFQMYVKYCENKPKSEYIVSEYDTFFDELRIKLNQKLNIQDLLIKPVQRIMKYQLMLKEIKKYMEKEGQDCKALNRAIEIMVTVPKNADDMMNVGRLQGFEGRITAQGRLLLQDTLNVHEPEDAKSKKDKQMKFKERRIFLFQQIVIFSEMIGSNKKFTSPHYVFKSDIKVNKLQLQKDDSQLSFTLIDKTPESNKKILCQCEDAAKYNLWIAHLQDLLDMQNKFLRDLQHPTLALKKSAGPSFASPSSSGNSSSNSGHSGSHTSSIASSVNEFFKSAFFGSSSNSNHSTSNHQQGSPATAPVLPSPASSTSSSSSSTFKTSKSTPASQHPATPTHANSFTLGQNYSGAAISPSPLSSGSSQFASSNGNKNNSELTALDNLNADLASQLSLDAAKKSPASAAIPNCAKVVSNYSAITEDEITVQQGDVVQIVTANMHNRFLVHREATDLQPAAEGWIPGYVIGFKSSNSIGGMQ